MAPFKSGSCLACLVVGLLVTAIALTILITQSALWDNRLADDDAAFDACFAVEAAHNQLLWDNGDDDRALTNLRTDFCVTAPPGCTDEELAQVSDGFKQKEKNAVNGTARATCFLSHPRTNTEPIRAIGVVVIWLVTAFVVFLILFFVAITRASKHRRGGAGAGGGGGADAENISTWRAFCDWCADMWTYGSLSREERRGSAGAGLLANAGGGGGGAAVNDDDDGGDPDE